MFQLKKTWERFPKTRSRFIAFIALMAVCVVTMGAVNDVSVKQITLREVNALENVDDSKTFKTRQATVEQFLKENNIIIGEYDKANYQTEEELTDNMLIEIRRGVPFVVVTADREISASTTMATVENALWEAGIKLGEQDEVSPDKNAPVTKDMRITLSKVEVADITQTEVIAHETVKEASSKMYKGESKVVREGNDGEKQVTYRVTRKDGEEIDREIVGETVTVAAVNTVIQEGTKEKEAAKPAAVLSSRSGGRYKKVVQCKATAYDTSPAQNGGHTTTAMGTRLGYGVIAVDPNVIPLGSRVYVESADGGNSWVYGYAIASDTGGAIKGNRVDLCFNSGGEAKQFGVKQATVYVLE